MLECVVNISEGRDRSLVAEIAAAAGPDLLDVHSDAHHHRSVLTLVGEEAPRAVATAAIAALDLRTHEGVHPRLGVVDVVPFVALDDATDADALLARDRFATWCASVHGVPCFTYGPERSLPDIRRRAFADLAPATGPASPHPTAGATAVGARPVLVAYNVWLADADVRTAQKVAAAVRAPGLRSLGLQVGDRAQVSMNLVDPHRLGPGAAYDLVRAAAEAAGVLPEGGELVGLLPRAVLEAIDPERWSALDLSPERTIEARLARRG